MVGERDHGPPSLRARFVARVTNPASLRSWTVDANDGIIATAGLLEGFAVAGATDALLITAATAATIAGGLSLGGAKWAEEATEREAQLAIVAQAEAEVTADPENEVAELAEYWEHKGLTPSVARQVAEQLSARDAVAAQLDAEYGIDEVMSAGAPVWEGATAAIAYMLGAAIPLLITIFVPVAVESWVILLAVLVSLTLTSLLAARAGHLSIPRTLLRTLAVGIGTLGVSLLAGLLLF